MPTFEMMVANGHVTAQFGEFSVPSGGEDEPTAFEFFLAGLGSCTAATLAGYCRAQQLPSEGLRVVMDVERNPETRMATFIKMQIMPPASFPIDRKAELTLAAERCLVKRHLLNPPKFETIVVD
jgi:ribosomal protein S12 methylthiotransferase accessory factor